MYLEIDIFSQINSSMIENLGNIKKYNPLANNHIEIGFKKDLLYK